MKKITIIFNFISDRLTLTWLRMPTVAIVLFLVQGLAGGADVPYLGDLEVKIRCHPSVVYRGDTFVVEFGSPHTGFDFGISRAAVHSKNHDLFLLSFKPGKNDHIAPVIPPQKFAAMRQVTLNTTTTRGSLSNLWRGEEVPRALKAPELIFTNSGLYEILLSLALGSEDAAYNGCDVYYINEEKQAGALLGDQALFGVMEDTFHQLACSASIWRSAIDCPTTPVYRGEMLALDLKSPYPASRIGIVDPGWNIYMLPVAKNLGPRAEGSFPGLRIIAGSESARAYSYQSAASPNVRSVHVDTRGGRVFRASGWYLAMPVPGPRCDSETDVSACWIHYIDAPRPQ
jgi:hypothetical protein